MTIFIEKFDSQSSPSINGMSLAVKDNIDVRGSVSSLGSAAFKSADKAKNNAHVVQALLDAGYQLRGKLNMHELAFGMTGVNQAFGTPSNPLFPEFITGGSSSGSAAAVAANMVDVSIGTDTGGSIRLPAACCSVIGLKPTFGRISRDGIQPVESELDCVGPFARSVSSIESAMEAMDSTFKPVECPEEIVLGLVNVEMSDDVRQVYSHCIERLSENQSLTFKSVNLKYLEEAFKAGLTVISREAAVAFGNLPVEQIGNDVASRLASARHINDQQLAQAREIKSAFVNELEQALSTVDVLVLPTLPSLPMTLADAVAGKVDLQASKFVRPFNVSGHPAISIPIAANRSPVSLQLVGAISQDETVCAIAKHIESLIEHPNYELNSTHG